MNNKTKAMLASYGRSLVGSLFTAIAIVGNGASPLTFSTSQWLDVSNALWAALIPVLMRWANKKDPAFGRIAESTAKEVSAKITAASKKAAVKKKP
jgi:hypothetical protein